MGVGVGGYMGELAGQDNDAATGRLFENSAGTGMVELVPRK